MEMARHRDDVAGWLELHPRAAQEAREAGPGECSRRAESTAWRGYPALGGDKRTVSAHVAFAPGAV